jgi:hypothetical protein
MNANRGRIADPGIECPFKVHNKDFSYIMANPFLEDGDQKIPVFFRDN